MSYVLLNDEVVDVRTDDICRRAPADDDGRSIASCWPVAGAPRSEEGGTRPGTGRRSSASPDGRGVSESVAKDTLLAPFLFGHCCGSMPLPAASDPWPGLISSFFSLPIDRSPASAAGGGPSGACWGRSTRTHCTDTVMPLSRFWGIGWPPLVVAFPDSLASPHPLTSF